MGQASRQPWQTGWLAGGTVRIMRGQFGGSNLQPISTFDPLRYSVRLHPPHSSKPLKHPYQVTTSGLQIWRSDSSQNCQIPCNLPRSLSSHPPFPLVGLPTLPASIRHTSFSRGRWCTISGYVSQHSIGFAFLIRMLSEKDRSVNQCYVT